MARQPGSMRIDFLADYPEYVASLAPALVEHWRFAFPDDTVDTRRGKLRQHLSRDVLPIAWAAHDHGEVYGTAALRECDLKGHEQFTPWLGGVFVLPDFRGKGIGSALCAAVEHHAGRTDICKLYLFTLDQQPLYSRLGWRALHPVIWRGFDGLLMEKGLTPA